MSNINMTPAVGAAIPNYYGYSPVLHYNPRGEFIRDFVSKHYETFGTDVQSLLKDAAAIYDFSVQKDIAK